LMLQLSIMRICLTSHRFRPIYFKTAILRTNPYELSAIFPE
jgi:hypothetical protein